MLEKDLNKEETNCFVDLIALLGLSDTQFNLKTELAEEIGNAMNKFILYEDFCERCTNSVLSLMHETESNHSR